MKKTEIGPEFERLEKAGLLERFKKIPERNLPSYEKFLINHGPTFRDISAFFAEECKRLNIEIESEINVDSKIGVKFYLTELSDVETAPYKKGDHISWELERWERKKKPYPAGMSIVDMVLMKEEYEDEPTVEGEFIGFISEKSHIKGAISTKNGIKTFYFQNESRLLINGKNCHEWKRT